MAEINLLKNELQGEGSISFRASRQKALYAVLAILLLEILGYSFFLVYNKQLGKRQLELDQKATEIDFEIGEKDEARLAALTHQARLNNIKVFLNNHLYWSEVLKELEKSTYKLASYASLQADQTNHKFNLTGSVPTYTDLAKLMLGFQTSPYFKDITLITTGLREGKTSGYQFTLELTFDPKLLLK
ncbi:MAG: PilN domain-containing protein [Candidatus Doudnabacteria bacterium]|nr:PilN domain-containing protein [Candidatus Doudnabacteria bacterium]